MPKTGYVKTSLGTGASGIKGIDGAVLYEGDFCWVGVTNLAYFYLLDADSGASESSPDILVPDSNPGQKRWILQNLLSSGFTATSTTTLTISVASKTLTVQTNKGFVVGMSVKIANTASPTNWMHGDITAYTPSTGVLVVNVTAINGSGTDVATWTISSSAPASSSLVYSFSRGGTLLNAVDGITAVNIFAWRATFSCTVTAVKGYRVGGTGATINARRNGASNHLASALSLTSESTVMDGGAVQNTAYVLGDVLEIMVVSTAGTVSQIGIQVDFTKT